MKHQSSEILKIKEALDNITKVKDEDDWQYDPYKYAAIYARKSILTENYSLDSQVLECKEYLGKQNLALYGVYKDEVSGKKPFQDRKEFTKLLNHLYAGMFKTVVIVRMDRLSRDINDFMRIKDIFKKNDVKVIYVKEPEINSSQQSYMENFLENMLIAISTFEPDNISDRTSAGKRKARENGIYPLRKEAPFGFLRTKESPLKYSINKSESSAVKMFTKNYIDPVHEKYTLKNLISSINNTLSLERQFKLSYVYNILKNPIYAKHMLIDTDISLTEMIVWNDETKEYYVSDSNLIEAKNIDGPIIDLDLWKKAVLKYHIPKLKKVNKSSNYLFKDIIYCGSCNKKVTLCDDTYSCGKNCISIEKSEAIQNVIKKIIHDIDNNSILDYLNGKISEVDKSIAKQKKKLCSIESELREQLHNYINNPSSKLIKDTYDKILDKRDNCKNEIESITKSYEEINREIHDPDYLKEQLSLMLSMDSPFIEKNITTLQDLFNLVEKVVITSTDEHKKSIEIQYK